MNNLDRLLQRNKEFAAQQYAAGTLMPSFPRAVPNIKAMIIGCADMRVDPAHVLGIKPGEAVVLRNIGGRITPGLLEQLGLLARIAEVPERLLEGRGVSPRRASAHRLRHDSPGRRRRQAGALFSNTGKRSQDKSGQRCSGGGRR